MLHAQRRLSIAQWSVQARRLAILRQLEDALLRLRRLDHLLDLVNSQVEIVFVRHDYGGLLRARFQRVRVLCLRWFGATSCARPALLVLPELLLGNLLSELGLVLKLRRLSLLTQEHIVAEDGAKRHPAINPSCLIRI